MKFFSQILLFLAFTLSVLCAKVDIQGLDKAQLLKALWENQKPAIGQRQRQAPFSNAEALKAAEDFIEYFHGRPIKTDISEDVAESFSYDLDAGEGMFAAVVKYLRNPDSLDHLYIKLDQIKNN